MEDTKLARALRRLRPKDVDRRVRNTGLHRLADGRMIAYTEFGDPRGFPTFYFHGTPSSRIEGAFADAAAAERGVRLIAVDRPGYGRSAFQRSRVFGDWPNDVCALADHLGFREFGVVGHSGAGPHLFACGVFINPARLKFIGALGPWGPISDPRVADGLNAVDRFYAGLAVRFPWLMNLAFAPLGWAAKFTPGLFAAIVRASVPPPDKAVLRHVGARRVFKRVQREAFRQGARGASYEALIAYRQWDFELSEVGAPTHIWLGAEDSFVSNEMGAFLRDAIPGAEFHLVPGKGHFNIENWADIFDACLRNIR